jgi:hypothetical protein
MLEDYRQRTQYMSPLPDISSLTPIEDLRGDSLEDTQLLNGMAEEATEFIGGFRWCKGIKRRYFGRGVGGIFAVFLFEIVPSSPEVDSMLWVIVGDLPSAFLLAEGNLTPDDALTGYVEAMEAWVTAAREGLPVDDLIPVNVEPTKENAERLASRLKFIREDFL